LSDEVIAAIEHELSEQFAAIGGPRKNSTYEAWHAQNSDCVRAMARVVAQFRPDYKLDRFYTNCGYRPPFPQGV